MWSLRDGEPDQVSSRCRVDIAGFSFQILCGAAVGTHNDAAHIVIGTHAVHTVVQMKFCLRFPTPTILPLSPPYVHTLLVNTIWGLL